MFGLYKNLLPVAPLVDDGVAGNRTPQRLAGTGATETRTSRRLTEGHLHLLMVGAVGVRVRFSSSSSLTAGTAVSNTRDVVYGPWTIVPFVPDVNSTFVYAEAADGAATYEAFVVSLQA
ncbi:MAG: hypothetical protein EBS53_00270 [Bacteroidetes bacterium]|nr:hypothetical protein [Bacteroidota bacterium]